MEFQVLGPLRVRDGPRAVPLTSAMQRTLLGILLAYTGRSVTADALVDALWPTEPGRRAGKNLQLHVHRLRRALDDAQRIRFQHGAYSLVIEPGELDAARFEELVADGTQLAEAGDPARAIEALRGALGLWRGPPFGDVADVPLVRVEVDRLAERYVVAAEELHAAELAAGHAAAVVPELAELAARHPLRERLQGLLMRSLYQSGRQAEALEVYRRTRAQLADELGLDPGPELRELERAILTADPALDRPTPAEPETGRVPAQLPADVADFTGRDAQLAELHQLLHPADAPAAPDAPAGPVPVVAVAGKAGVGKTSLALHAAHQLRDRFPDGQLHVDLRGAGGHPRASIDVLARFLRALGVPGSGLPDDPDERAALYRSRLAGRRILVLLDNAADEAQVRPLLPGSAGGAVLVTSRSRLAGLPSVRMVDLDILDAEHAVELLARTAGSQRVADEPAAAARIVALCGRLPLAVRVAGARLGARPHWRLERLAAGLADERRRLDELRLGDLEVRASFVLSYDGLDGPARVAFRRLGLLDAPDFAAWAAAAVLPAAQYGAEDLVDVLVDAQLLDVARRDGTGQLRYRFHDLLRAFARERAAAEDPEPERSAAVLRALSGWVVLAGTAAERTISSTFGIPVGEVPGWEPDADVAAVALADPAAWFEAEWPALMSAVEQAADVGADALLCGLVERLAGFFVLRGRYDDWQHCGDVMIGAARRLGADRWAALALRGLGELALLQSRVAVAIEHFRGALEAYAAAADPYGIAVASSGLGAALVEAGQYAEAQDRLDEALPVLREVGDRRSEAWAVRRLGSLHQLQGNHAEATAWFGKALGILDQDRDPLGVAGVLEKIGASGIAEGGGSETRDLLEQALELRRAHRNRFGEARALGLLGELHHVEHRPAEAVDCLSQALHLWRMLRLVHEQARALELLGDVHEAAGDDEAARTTRDEAQRVLAAPD